MRAASARCAVASDRRYATLVGARRLSRWVLNRALSTRLRWIACASGGASSVTTTSTLSAGAAFAAAGKKKAATAAARRRLFFKSKTLDERCQDLLHVLLGLDAPEHPGDVALGVDHDRRALDPHVFLPVVALLDPEAVLLGQLVVRIGEEREGKPVLLPELRVRLLGVRADAEHDRARPLELAPLVADAARLCRAAGRVVPRIEIEDDRPATKLRQGHRGTGVRRQSEVGSRRTFGHHVGQPIPSTSAGRTVSPALWSSKSGCRLNFRDHDPGLHCPPARMWRNW